MKYTKKPVEVEAGQWDNTDDKTRLEVFSWLFAHNVEFTYNSEYGELKVNGTSVHHQDFIVIELGRAPVMYPPSSFNLLYDKV